MYGIKAIIGKELTRVFKDKKMIMSLFVLPVVLVVGLFSLMSFMIKGQTEDIESHVPVVYIQNAPDSFIEYASQTGADWYKEADDSDAAGIKQELVDGTADVLICFPEGFEEAVTTGLTDAASVTIPNISIYFNPSEEYSGEARNICQTFLEEYKQTLLAQRFGDYSAVVMFSVEDNYVQDEEKATGKMLGMMLPYFITMLIFAGAMGLGVDMIAGEKERGTLATMLLSPVNRSQIVLGKVFALAVLAVMSAAVYVIAMIIALPIMFSSIGDDSLAGLSVNFTGTQIAQIVILMIGVVLLYVSIICMVAVYARNVKEASSYITPVYLVVIVTGMLTMYSSAEGVFYKYLIPVYGSSMAFKDILTREITTANFVGTTISTYLIAVVLVAIMTKAFNSEKVMFNA